MCGNGQTELPLDYKLEASRFVHISLVQFALHARIRKYRPVHSLNAGIRLAKKVIPASQVDRPCTQEDDGLEP